jgi:hypothetical protein
VTAPATAIAPAPAAADEAELETGERPARSGFGWTDDEDKQIMAEYKGSKGLSTNDIALAHKRSVAAIRTRLKFLGVWV